jgi:hypothetical protein
MNRTRRLLVLAAGSSVLAAFCIPGAAQAAIARASAASAVRVHTGTIVAINANQSSNWSGYNQGTLEKNVSGFHSVSGDWIVPTASPHKSRESEFSATWVGIGGGCVDANCMQTDNTLIQTGTEQDVSYNALAGTTTEQYSAWWELIPQASTPIDTMTVKPGDHMHATIVETPVGSENWTITLTDVTSGQTFNTTVSYQSTYATAEWIVEQPTVVSVLPLPPSVGDGPLPNLGTVQFSAATANGQSAGLVTREEVQMTDLLFNPIATPSAPNGGNAFGDCIWASTC